MFFAFSPACDFLTSLWLGDLLPLRLLAQSPFWDRVGTLLHAQLDPLAPLSRHISNSKSKSGQRELGRKQCEK